MYSANPIGEDVGIPPVTRVGFMSDRWMSAFQEFSHDTLCCPTEGRGTCMALFVEMGIEEQTVRVGSA